MKLLIYKNTTRHTQRYILLIGGVVQFSSKALSIMTSAALDAGDTSSPFY